MLRYETGDACGQNMSTICSQRICEWLLDAVKHEMPQDQLNITHCYITTGSDGDKQVNITASSLGRGIEATAKATIPEELLVKHFRVTSDDVMTLFRCVSRANGRFGSVTGVRGPLTNSLAAIFASTGQDLGCVAESANANMSVAKGPDGGLEFTHVLYNLMLGTVGGGTGLPSQAACLDLIGCKGPGKRRKLAEIVVSSSLALELSVSAAVASGEFTKSHERLGRNKPVVTE